LEIKELRFTLGHYAQTPRQSSEFNLLILHYISRCFYILNSQDYSVFPSVDWTRMELGHNLRAVFNGTRTCISAKSIELGLLMALRFYTYHERRNCMTAINTLDDFTVGDLRRESSLRISRLSLADLSLLSSLS